tara:strand:- start:10329 stop:11033 length:705 start_codon:yes stop_codon:yes gene_type:complete
MGKAVKTIAKVAAVAAAVYYGGPAIAKSFGGTPTFGSTAFWKGTSSNMFGGSFIGRAASAGLKYAVKNPMTTASLALQGGGLYAQNKYNTMSANYQQEASNAQREINRINLRKSNVQANKIRLAKEQERYILAARNETSLAPFGPGTSSYQGSQGALKTDYANVVGDLNMAQGFAADLSQQTDVYGRAMTGAKESAGFATGAGNITTAGMNIFRTLGAGGDSNLYTRSLITPMV